MPGCRSLQHRKALLELQRKARGARALRNTKSGIRPEGGIDVRPGNQYADDARTANRPGNQYADDARTAKLRAGRIPTGLCGADTLYF